jgi:hypothetical protein
MDLAFATTTLMEAQTTFTHSGTVPFLTGKNSLTEGNSLEGSWGLRVNPITVNAFANGVWTPAAFFKITGGVEVGTGWRIPIAEGLAYNDEHHGIVDASLQGAVWTLRGGCVIQFDLAALWPGDWHHLVFRVSPEFIYRSFTKASSRDSWIFEDEDGDERNGWNWYAMYFIGFQPPLPLDLIGIMVEQKKYLYGIEGSEYWGGDLSRWIFGPVANVSIGEKVDLTLSAQFWSVRNYTEATKDEEYYENRELDRDDPLRVEFYRAALILNYRL